MRGWENFFMAEAGASAALAGLIFVGISMNLEKIMANQLFKRFLPPIALMALMVLIEVLVISSLMLIPGQPLRAQGIEVGCIGLLCWIAMTGLATFQTLQARQQTARAYSAWYAVASYLLLGQIPTVPFVIAGILLLLQIESGVYWMVPGILSALPFALYIAWVLGIEIRR